MIRSIVREIVGLFVDDGLLASGLIAWTLVIVALRFAVPALASVLAVSFAIGCGAVLLASIARSR